MCKAHSKVTHIKQQKYFYHLKGRVYNKNCIISRALEVMKFFGCFICVTLLWALHIVIKQQFFLHLFLLRASIGTRSSAVAERPCDTSFVSLNILPSHTRSLEVIRNDTLERGVRVNPYYYFITTMSVSRQIMA